MGFFLIKLQTLYPFFKFTGPSQFKAFTFLHTKTSRKQQSAANGANFLLRSIGAKLEQMAAAFVDLKQILKWEKLTPKEESVLRACEFKAVRGLMNGALIGGTVAFAATRKLDRFSQVFLSVGVAGLLGLEIFDSIVNKHQDNPWTMQRMHRLFYQEKVFDDSSLDKPILKWRYRNFFGNDCVHGRRTNYSDSHVLHNYSDSKEVPLAAKQVPMNPDVDMMEDPLDSIFGHMAPMEEIRHLSSSSTPSRADTRSHRRSRRRRRLQNYESLGLKDAQPQLV
ncbi:uncharacterized protein LOC8280906 isoform X2 [Ricinus communis]|uniref:uncharacterized protein LOC8280906 isoform X2 n=1 Tax=Ricinus communis TaxID=3988 RepID=UPI00201AAAC8|nr:uncharacterized protein LOC8280906 isoform X2 [Ricinus communis]